MAATITINQLPVANYTELSNADTVLIIDAETTAAKQVTLANLSTYNSVLVNAELVSNVATLNASINAVNANLVSNVSTLSSSINTVNANLLSNVATLNSSIATVNANLVANVSTLSSSIATVNANLLSNVATLTTAISTVNNNATAAINLVNANLVSNVSTLTTAINTVNSNATTAVNLVNANLVSNVSTLSSAVNVVNTNVNNLINGSTAFTGTVTMNNDLVVSGNLTINGTTSTINSTTLTVDDKNIELGSIASPTDITADGGGITLRGTTDKSITWNAASGWTSSETLNLVSGKNYKINGVDVISSTALGTGILSSSLTSLGTINIGTWNGSIIGAAYGGTGQTTLPKAMAALKGFQTITSTGGTTTLDATSPETILVTGTLTHTIILPDVTTLALGWTFNIINSGTNTITIQSSGLNAYSTTLLSNTAIRVICVAITGNTMASWFVSFDGSTTRAGGGAAVFASAPDIQGIKALVNVVTAGTNAQGSGQLSTTTDVVNLTSTPNNPSAITLPVTTSGRRIFVHNRGTNPVNVYPGTGCTLDALAVNIPIQIPVGAVLIFNSISATQWYSSLNIAGASATALTGTVTPTSGGTGQTTLPKALAALLGYQTITSSSGTTALDVTSPENIVVTGTLSHTITLPDVTTLSLGWTFYIVNNSTSSITINSSGSNLVRILGPGTRCIVTCVAVTGTTAASWSALYIGVSISDGKVFTVQNNLTFSGTDGTSFTLPSTSGAVALNSAIDNIQSGTTYTLVLADANLELGLTNATSCVVSIPLNSTAAFPIGTRIPVWADGVGTYSIVAVSGVSLNGISTGTRTGVITVNTSGVRNAVILRKIGTDSWTVSGSIGVVV